jgi:hypothetical protein
MQLISSLRPQMLSLIMLSKQGTAPTSLISAMAFSWLESIARIPINSSESRRKEMKRDA